MKLLVKISFISVITLFASIGVKAQIITTADDILELTLSSANVAFVQDYNTRAADQTTTVTIRSNVKWKLSVATNDIPFTSTTTTDQFDLSKVTLTGLITGTFGGLLQTRGENDMTDQIYWHLSDLGNIYAGYYSVPLTFTLIKDDL